VRYKIFYYIVNIKYVQNSLENKLFYGVGGVIATPPPSDPPMERSVDSVTNYRQTVQHSLYLFMYPRLAHLYFNSLIIDYNFKVKAVLRNSRAIISICVLYIKRGVILIDDFESKKMWVHVRSRKVGLT